MEIKAFKERVFFWKEYSKDDTAIIKAIAIFLIMFHNYFHWVAPNTGENEFEFVQIKVLNFCTYLYQQPGEFIHIFFSYLGHYGVQLFIFLSSYGLAKSYFAKEKHNWAKFVWTRLSKLYPAFIISAFVLVLIFFYKDNALPSVTFLRQLFYRLILVSNLIPGMALSINGPWWFYSFIVQFYLLFLPLMWLDKKTHSYSTIFLILFGILLPYLINPYFLKVNLNVYHQCLGHLPELCLGILLSRYQTLKVNKAFFLLFFIVFLLGNIYQNFWYGSFLMVTLLMLYAINPVIVKIHEAPKTRKFFIYIGNLSMYLFACHGFLRDPFTSTASKYANNWITLLLGISFVLISILVANGVKYLEFGIREIIRKN